MEKKLHSSHIIILLSNSKELCLSPTFKNMNTSAHFTWKTVPNFWRIVAKRSTTRSRKSYCVMCQKCSTRGTQCTIYLYSQKCKTVPDYAVFYKLIKES